MTAHLWEPPAFDRIERGGPSDLAREYAALFYEAFGAPLSVWPLLPRDRDRAVELVADSMRPDSVYLALDAERRVLGVAFAGYGGELLCLRRRALERAYGRFGASWRIALLRLTGRRPPKHDAWHLEGFAVVPDRRGRGVGTAMLGRIVADARAERVPAIELTVGDTNDGARRLYERFGFAEAGSRATGPFAGVLGFERFVEMRLELR